MTGTTLDVDVTDRSLYRNGFPHELFTELRARGAVLRHPKVVLERAPEGMDFWVVTRHAEVLEASRDWQRFSSLDGPALSPVDGMQESHTLVFADPPTHTRLRKLISAGFTPRMIARLDEQITRRAGEILDAVDERDGEVDFVRDIAYVLPMQLIGDIIGIPESDRPYVFGLTDVFMRAGDPESGLTPDDRERVQVDLYMYATELGARKRAQPEDDVWSILASAEIDDEGERVRLSDFQLDVFFLILSVAGSETTRNAISQGLAALAERPDDLRALRNDPALWDTATDEIIRWASPVTDFGRTATRDTSLGGGGHRRGRAGCALLSVGEPRRTGLRRSVPLRRPPGSESPRVVRRGRRALLPRCAPRAARDPHAVRAALGAVRSRRHHR